MMQSAEQLHTEEPGQEPESLLTADLYDHYGDRLDICQPIFRDYGGDKQFHGEVVTLKCFEDNSLVREILGEYGEGKVLVVDGGASLRCAMLGDLLAQKGVDNDWAGVVINGCIRDSAAIKQMPIGVKALATNPRKTVKKGVGERDVPLTFAGVTIHPGDTLYADEDGICILPG